MMNKEYLFFWGHTQKEEIDKSCMSQWYPSCFVVEDTIYTTAEHYMMAQKAILFGDDDSVFEILKTFSPKEAKRLGRKVKNFDADVWNKNAYRIVIEANHAKFNQNKDLYNYLKNTGEDILVEASPYDKIWGIGMSQNHPDILDESKWKGQNLLGQALMVVRDHL